MKNWYVTVVLKYSTVFSKQCKDVKEANELLKLKKEEFKAPYYVTKEWY
jgi:hypothetical protein